MDAGQRRGELSTGGVERLLVDLGRERATGLLELYARGRVSRLWIRRGVPIHASPGGERAWRLGEVLERLGETQERGLGDALAGRGPLGQGLVSRRLISRSTLERALKEQLRLRVAELVSLTEGRYRFFGGAEHLAGAPRQPDRWTAPELIAAAGRGAGLRPKADHLAPLRREVRRLEEAGDPLIALGLFEGASPRAIKAAFRALAVAHHPDRLIALTDPVALALHRRAFAAAVRAKELALG